jgi:hypothetical protein
MIGFIDTLYTQLITTINYSSLAISTLHSSLLHTLMSTVFSSCILTTDSLHSLIPFMPFLLNYCANCQLWRHSQFSAATANSGTRLNSNPSCLRSPLYRPRGAPHGQHRFLHCCVLIHCLRDVFTAPLPSNKRGADHRRHRSSIVARSLNVFTEPLPSNELLRLSGVMSQ